MTAATSRSEPTITRKLVSSVALAALAIPAVSLVLDQNIGPVPSLTVAAGMTAAFLAARLLTIRLPRGDEVSATLIVGLVGIALVHLPVLIVSSVIAGVADAALRYTPDSRNQTLDRLVDALRSTAVVGLLSPWQLALYPILSPVSGDRIIAVSLIAGITYGCVDLFTAALQQTISRRRSLVRGLSSLVRPLGTVYIVHVPLAAVVLRLNDVSTVWPFAVAVLLTLILQNSFNLYLRIRRAYNETILALAHAAELDRPIDSGHAKRVAELSVVVGRRMGLSGRELERIGYAALLHDIGRMGAPAESPEAQVRRGADIAASIPFLKDVAPLIQSQGSNTDDSARLGGEIVRVCAEYDRLRIDVGAPYALRLVAADDRGHDRQVIHALEHVVSNG